MVENTPVRHIIEYAVVAVDLAKNAFEVTVSDVPGTGALPHLSSHFET